MAADRAPAAVRAARALRQRLVLARAPYVRPLPQPQRAPSCKDRVARGAVLSWLMLSRRHVRGPFFKVDVFSLSLTCFALLALRLCRA